MGLGVRYVDRDEGYGSFFFLKWGVGKKGGQYNLLSSISNSPPIK